MSDSTVTPEVLSLTRRVYPILHLIGEGKAVTPTEISAVVRPAGSTLDYSSKYMTFLRRLGFDFTIQKDGRKIVSYTCIVEPNNVGDIRAVTPKSQAVKVQSAPAKVKPAKAKTDVKAKNLATLKAVGERLQSMNDTISTFSVDEDWDSVDNLDLKKLVG